MDVIKQSFIDLFLIPCYGKDVGLHYGKCLDTEYSLAVIQSCWEAWKLAKTSDKNIEELKKESDHFRLAAKAESERVNELQNEIKKLRKRVTVRYNELISSDSKDTYSLYLPRIIEFRLDKEDADSLETIKATKNRKKA